MNEDGPAILVVDDEEDNRYTVTRRLTRLGYANIAQAVNGRQALDMLAQRHFDAVLLDIMMPELDGYTVLERMKSDKRLRDVPVIMISALDQLDSAVRCIELGAEDYLTKPFNSVLLRARLGACLDRKKFRDREVAYLREIERQRRRADELLHVIMPTQAVEELKTTNRVKPRRYDDVAVLFCDIVDFSPYCDRHDPEEVVTNLQQLVEAFEAAIAAHNIEKIKTIGDAFMATAGLLQPNADPVLACVRCAFDMIAAAQRVPAEWNVRVGIHAGPVVAGIIGRKKFAFDLWGDTINLAERLSSHGPGGSVNLSGAAWSRVGHRCSGEPLGLVALKGLGDVEVFRCAALHPEPGE